jgi:hypothetical protein
MARLAISSTRQGPEPDPLECLYVNARVRRYVGGRRWKRGASGYRIGGHGVEKLVNDRQRLLVSRFIGNRDAQTERLVKREPVPGNGGKMHFTVLGCA